MILKSYRFFGRKEYSFYYLGFPHNINIIDAWQISLINCDTFNPFPYLNRANRSAHRSIKIPSGLASRKFKGQLKSFNNELGLPKTSSFILHQYRESI